MDAPTTRIRFEFIAGSWGLLGGAALVVADALSTRDSRANVTMGIFAVIVIGTAIAVRRAGGAARRFRLGLGTFMVATAVMYLYVIVVLNPAALRMPIWGHAWRFAFFTALGSVATGIPLAVSAMVGKFGGGRGASPEQRGQIRLKDGRSKPPRGPIQRTKSPLAAGAD